MEQQEQDPGSTLWHYRRLLAARRRLLAGEAPLVWLETTADVLAFRRGPLECWLNFGPRPVTLPSGRTVAVASGPLRDGELPPDTAVWLLAGPSGHLA